jgi:hypothetical protein
MGIKKVRYNTGEDIVDIKIRDSTGAEREKWIIMMSDFTKVMEILKKKYGLGRPKENKDLDWAL